MKYALIIPDGCADEPQPELDGQTPLQAARTPRMDAVVRQGVIGRTVTVPDSMPSGSDVGTMSLFGYDPLRFHSGRAPLEAAAQGIELGPGDWAIRCNLVTVENGIMRSFTAGQIDDEFARHLIANLQKEYCGDPAWKFHHGVSYRNLLIHRCRNQSAPFSEETLTCPPHDVTDKSIAGFLPTGPGSNDLRQLMDCSVAVFNGSQPTQSRRATGDLSATQIWLWGLGQRPALDSFEERYGKRAAVITAVDLLRGLARLMGWSIVDVPGATGYIDTDYAAKGQYAIQTLQDVEFVVVHVEAPDEASHEGDTRAKIHALEYIDRDVVGPVHDYLKKQGDYRILVAPDHPTFLRTKTHSHGEVPFALCGTGITADAHVNYDEPTAARSKLFVPEGHELMPLLFSSTV